MTPWSQSTSCPKHIEFLDTETAANSCVETSLGINSYYGSCKQSELTACQALSHEKWKMNDDNDGQVNCFRGGAVSEVLPRLYPTRCSSSPACPLAPPVIDQKAFFWLLNFFGLETWLCIYPKSVSISGQVSLAQVSAAVAVPFVTCLVYGLLGCVCFFTLSEPNRLPPGS